MNSEYCYYTFLNNVFALCLEHSKGEKNPDNPEKLAGTTSKKDLSLLRKPVFAIL